MAPAREPRGWTRRWGLFTALFVSHLALDLVTRDARPPYGFPFFWPFSDDPVHTSIELFPNMQRGSLAVALSAENWRALLTEVALLGPFLLAMAVYRSKKAPRL